MSLLRDRMERDMERAGLAPRTRYRYIRAIRMLAKFHGRSPDLLTDEDLRAWDEDMVRRGLSPSSRSVYLGAALFLFRRTLRRPEVVAFLAHPKQHRKLPTVLSLPEVVRLLAAVRVLRYRAFFSLIFDTGLRISEAAALKVGDIDRARGVIQVRNGKGGKDRQVKLGDRLYGILRAYWLEERVKVPRTEPLSKDSFLFASVTGRPLCIVVAGRVIRRAAEEAGIGKRVTPHTLRHSLARACGPRGFAPAIGFADSALFASRMVATAQMEAGTGLRVVQAQLGHASIRTTQRYLHVATHLILQAPSPLDALIP